MIETLFAELAAPNSSPAMVPISVLREALQSNKIVGMTPKQQERVAARLAEDEEDRIASQLDWEQFW